MNNQNRTKNIALLESLGIGQRLRIQKKIHVTSKFLLKIHYFSEQNTEKLDQKINTK